jgi:hypothetical protein
VRRSQKLGFAPTEVAGVAAGAVGIADGRGADAGAAAGLRTAALLGLRRFAAFRAAGFRAADFFAALRLAGLRAAAFLVLRRLAGLRAAVFLVPRLAAFRLAGARLVVFRAVLLRFAVPRLAGARFVALRFVVLPRRFALRFAGMGFPFTHAPNGADREKACHAALRNGWMLKRLRSRE